MKTPSGITGNTVTRQSFPTLMIFNQTSRTNSQLCKQKGRRNLWKLAREKVESEFGTRKKQATIHFQLTCSCFLLSLKTPSPVWKEHSIFHQEILCTNDAVLFYSEDNLNSPFSLDVRWSRFRDSLLWYVVMITMKLIRLTNICRLERRKPLANWSLLL